jgi:hypothetical protein
MTCQVVHSGVAYEGKQGFTYLRGLTGETVGSQGISMTVLALPDGARAKTHLHREVETAVYVIEGRAEMFYGPRLGEHLVAESGDSEGGRHARRPARASHGRSDADAGDTIPFGEGRTLRVSKRGSEGG